MPADGRARTTGPIDPAQRRLAERRLLAALRRFHRSQPLAGDIRTDALIARLRSEPDERRPRGHRGGGRLELDDAALRTVVDELVATGKIEQNGRRLRLSGQQPAISDEMSARVDALLAGLREAGAEPPRVEAVAARMGVPPPVLDQLRSGGELVAVSPAIDYPRDVYDRLQGRLDELAAQGPLTVARVRDALHTSRRYAAALIEHRRGRRAQT